MNKFLKSIFVCTMFFIFSLALFACKTSEDNPDDTSIIINNMVSEMKVGETFELDFTVKDGLEATVESSDETIVSVLDKTLTALKEGEVMITISVGNVKKELKVTVKEELPVVITITNKVSSMEIGDTFEVGFSVENFDGEVIISSSDSSIISVSSKTLSAVKEGTVTITITAGNVSASFEVTVNPAIVEVKYTVKFVDADGTVLAEALVNEGEEATAPEITDELFKGWDKDFSNITSDLVVTAQYKKISKLLYLLYGGQFEEGEGTTNQYIEGEELELDIPYKEGYDFVGWAKEANSSDTFTTLPTSCEGEVVLFAIWAKAGAKTVTFDFNGGSSDELYLANKSSATTSLTINNFNNSDGTFWGGGYANYVYLTDSSKDPTATFSDRIYIGKDENTGLYKIINILTSGASSWPAGAEYVISISSSYSGYYTCHKEVLKLKVGMTVIFDGNFTTFCGSNPGKVYFFDGELSKQTITLEMEDGDKFITPTLLGATFDGWFDENNNKVEKLSDIRTKKVTLTAKWTFLNPVTGIDIHDICTEMTTSSSYQIVANVVPVNAHFQDILYSSSNPDVVSVDANGLLTSTNTGTAVITITDYVKNIVIEKTITVYPIESIDLAFEDDFYGVLNVGETVQLNPIAYGKGVVNPQYTYTSSDLGILEVNDEGLVTAKGLGTATITITDNTGSDFALIVGITVNPLSTEAAIDKLLSLIAKNNFATIETGNMCLYNDGTDRYYDSMYGSVNKYLFAPYVVNTDYAATAAANSNGHRDRRFTGGFDDKIEFVTVHDTATLTGTVQAIASNMASGGTSIHYTVGNDAIYQVVPEEYIAYHAGDGTGTPFKWVATGVKATGIDVNDYRTYPTWDIVQEGSKWYWVINGAKSSVEAPISNGSTTIKNPSKANITDLGPTWKIVGDEIYIGNTWVCFSQMAIGAIGSRGGNNNSIGIEMCVNTSSDIYDTLQRTAQLVADILIRNNLDLSRVKMHNTYSGKNCPQVLRAGNYWWNFIDMVALNYEIMKNYPTAEITMVSDNPQIVDNTGRVIKAPNTTTTVSYTVTVKLNGQTKSIKLYSVVPGATTWEQWNGRYPASLIWNDGNYKR